MLNDKEFGYFKFLKLKYRRGDQIIQPYYRIGFPEEFRSPLVNLKKPHKTEKSTAEPCRLHRNLLKNEEFGSLKYLKLKYRRGNHMIQSFYRIGLPKEITCPHFNLKKSYKTQKSTNESCKMR